MNFHILTLFPDMVTQGLANSITGRAIKENKISVDAVNIRDFADNKHRKVDDYTYGGGAGMLMQPQPVYDAWKSVQPDDTKRIRTIYVTPQGHTFNQKMAEEFAKEDELVILCGHYEGIDERVLEEVVTDYVSIGDYVLTGGELAAMVMVDAIARLVPGVLNNDSSAEIESFHGNLLEYPQYSRPEVWHDKPVPKALLSGNPKEIGAWRLEQAVKRTKARRPDLYEKYLELQECMQLLLEQKLLHIDMIECIRRGSAELIYRNGREILLRDKDSDVYMHTNPEENGEFLAKLPLIKMAKIHCVVIHQECFIPLAQACTRGTAGGACRQAVYTRKEKMPISGLYRADGTPMPNGLVIHELREEDVKTAGEAYVAYGYLSKQEATEERKVEVIAEVRERFLDKAIFGAYIRAEDGTEAFAGFIGKYEEGSVGMLTVLPEYRGQKIALALEAYMINRELEQGFTPYGQVCEDNTASIKLQQKVGLCFSKTPVFWVY